MRKIFIGIGIFIGCLLLILFIAIQIFQTGYVQRIVQKKINALIPGQLTWKHLRFSLMRGEVELTQFSLLGPSGETIAGIERLWVDGDWLPLLSRQIIINTFNAKSPRVHLLIEKDGKLNLESAFSDGSGIENPPKVSQESSGSGFPFNIILKSVSLRDGVVSFATFDHKTDIDIHDIQIKGDGDLYRERAKIQITLGDSHLKINDIDTSIDQVSLSTSYQKNQVKRLDLTLRTPATTVSLTGRAADLFQMPRVDMKLDINGALSEIDSILNLKGNLSGQVDLHLHASGLIDNPDADLNLNCRNAVLFSQPVEKLQLTIALKDRIAGLNDMYVSTASGESRLTGSVDLQSAFPHGFFEIAPRIERISYDLHLTQQGIRLEQLAGMVKTVSGELASRIDMSGKGISPDTLSANMNLDISAKNLSSEKFREIPPVRITGNTVFDQNELIIRSLKLSSKETSFQAAGKWHLADKTISAAVDLDSQDIQPLLSMVGLGEYRGGVYVKARIDGPVMSPEADVRLSGRGLSTGDIVLGNLAVTARVDQSGMLDISQLNLKNQNSIIDGQGHIRLFKDRTPLGMSMPVSLTLNFRQIAPRFFYQTSPVVGEMDGHLTVEGPFNQPKASLNLNGTAVQIRAIALGNVSAGLHFQKGRLYIDHTDIRNKNSILKITGNVQLLEEGAFTPVESPVFAADIKGDRIFLSDILDNENIQGVFSLNAQIKGRPEDILGRLNLKGSDIILYQQPIDSLLLNADLMGNKVTIQPLDISISSRNVIHMTGWASRDKTYEVVLTADGVDVHQIQSLRKIGDFTGGKLSLHVNGNGSFDDPRINGDIKMTHMQINNKAIKDLSLSFGLADQLLGISGDLHCDVEGTYNLSDSRFSLKARFPNTDLSPYLMLLNQPDISGHLLGEIEFAGTGGSPDTYVGELDISELNLLYKNESLIHGTNLHVLLKEQEINTRDFSLVFLNKGRLNINSQIKADETMSLMVDGKIPLSVINAFQKELPDINGDLLINANVQGTLSSPRFQADIAVKDLKTVVPYLYQTLHDTEAEIKITPKEIDISAIKGQLDSGTFDISGRMVIDRLKPVSIMSRIKIRQLPINVPDILDILFNSDIALNGTLKTSRIEGELIVLDGLYYSNVNLNPLSGIGQKKRQGQVPAKPLELPFLSGAELNIDVKYRKPLSVDNNVARMDILPELKITGILNHPVINGRMAVQSGEVMYRGKIFAIKKGIIDFINPYETEPSIDILADHQIRDWLIHLSMSGKPDHLAFKLSSEPSLGDSDIVSLLLFGQTSDELRKGEGGSNLSAADMLTQFIASRYNEEIKSATGLDIFEAETSNGENNNGSSGVKVTLGKELTKRITVKYSIESENGNIIQRAIAEYKLLEEVLLSIFQGNNGIFGGGATYRLEFR